MIRHSHAPVYVTSRPVREMTSGEYVCSRCGITKTKRPERVKPKMCTDRQSVTRYEQNAHLRATAVDMRREGKTLAEIGRELGTSRSVVADWIREEMQYAEDVA